MGAAGSSRPAQLSHEAWIGGHHSAGFEIIACPELFIAAAAERTRHIRLGTGVDRSRRFCYSPDAFRSMGSIRSSEQPPVADEDVAGERPATRAARCPFSSSPHHRCTPGTSKFHMVVTINLEFL